jgi:alkylation response protein AidB-like acyl-CoA dehydrogenase
MTSPALPELRRSDFSLSDVQRALRHSVAQFFERECPPDVVRDAEPVAFDTGLWDKVRRLGVLTMAVPVDSGGDGAGLVEAALVAEECGRRIAPVPFVEHVVASRVLAARGALASWTTGERVLTFAPVEQHGPGGRVVPMAAIAGGVVGLRDGVLVLTEPDAPIELADTLGGAPLGWFDLALGDTTPLARDADARAIHARARREWQVLTAAALVGLADGALDLTVRYANERIAFGVPIGTFQALSHPLVDVRVAVEGARHLVWQAAWYLDHEPDAADLHVAVAFLHACETAQLATARGIHTQGGFGFTLESDLHLYFRRAKSWPLVAGDPRRALVDIADLAFGHTS